MTTVTLPVASSGKVISMVPLLTSISISAVSFALTVNLVELVNGAYLSSPMNLTTAVYSPAAKSATDNLPNPFVMFT